MTYEELQSCVLSIQKIGSGHWKVAIKYYGGVYYGTTTNSLAIDGLHDDSVADNVSRHGYTAKQALQALYDSVKWSNHLGYNI